jgi:hypothetical protein
MKKVYIIGSMVFDSPTTKVQKFRICTTPTQNSAKEIKTENIMKTFILVGEQAIDDFYNRDWEALEKLILGNQNGDIIAWNRETDKIGTLLDMLNGWNDFIELSQQDLKDIEANTKIEILW